MYICIYLYIYVSFKDNKYMNVYYQPVYVYINTYIYIYLYPEGRFRSRSNSLQGDEGLVQALKSLDSREDTVDGIQVYLYAYIYVYLFIYVYIGMYMRILMVFYICVWIVERALLMGRRYATNSSSYPILSNPKNHNIICIYVVIYLYISACTHLYICVHIPIFNHIFNQIHIYIYIYTYTGI
jgi:hypothetical protein